MELSTEQINYIEKHLRRPENEKGIAEIAESIAKEFQKVGGDIDHKIVRLTAYIMNLGETDERIAYIYDPSWNWKEHPEAIELNKQHGKYSVEMAEKIGIDLTEEQKEVIEGHSKQEYKTALAQIIKVAEICKATESPIRWYRGEKKEAAKSWNEVYEVLKEDKAINPAIIVIAANSYGKTRFKKIKQEEKEK